jgi:Tfp pilus assembly protein PilN
MNLLPQHQKDAIYQDILLRFFLVVIVIVCFWTLIFLVVAYNQVLYLNTQTPALDQRIAHEQETEVSKTLASIEGEIQDLNSILAQIGGVRDKKSRDYTKVLRSLGGLIPPGVTFSSVSFQGGTMNVVGRADTRALVLILKSNLEESICSSISIPVITRETDVDIGFNCALR